MKYLILSDIHGSRPRLEQALDFYYREHCDMLLILGDILNYGPRNSVPEGLDAKGIVELLNPLADDIVAVRGNCDAEVDQMLLHFPIMETTALLIENGRRILLTHGHIYNKEHLPAGRFDAVCYGHTHLWELTKQDNGPVILNSGSITFPKGGNPPTMVTLENGLFSVYTLDGNLLSSLHL
ncbi:MAG: phosphodiesterase [Prevotella sp.]|jgi:putative phosphoesterase